METRIMIRNMTTLILLLAMLLFNVTPFPSSAANAAFVDENDLTEGARQFDDAVRDVESILKSDLSTEKGVRDAAAVLKKNEKKFAQVEKKALHAALRVTAFQKGLRDEAAKRKGGAEELARELETNRDLLGSIPGVEEAAKAIKESTRPAAETLKKVSEALKKAADEAKAKNNPGNLHHADLRRNSETEVQGFCGSYEYICDLLLRLGQYYLRRQLSLIASAGGKATCVLRAYSTYSYCTVSHWWELAYCNSNLATNIGNCLFFG